MESPVLQNNPESGHTGKSAGIFRRFQSIAEQHAEDVAVTVSETDCDYRSLLQLVNGCAATLLEHGVGRGDVVALALPNSLDFVVVTLATMAIDAVLMPLNPAFKPDELQYYLDKSSPKAVFCPGELKSTIVGAVDPQTALFETVTNLPVSNETLYVHSADGSSHLPALYMFSSGSTGKSKRITRTQGQVMSEYLALAQTIDLQPSDCILCTIPLYHAHGFGNTLMAALLTGARLLLLTHEFNPRATIRTMESQGVTVYPAVPFMFKMLADTRLTDNPDLKERLLFISAGAKLEEDTSDRFLQKFGKSISQLYGSTETGAICINLDHSLDKASSVGRPLVGYTVSIVDSDGMQVNYDTEGEIWITSPAMTDKYDDLPEITSECFSGNGFFAGDLGYLDKQGDLYITGRKKLMINVAGYKVDPLEVEQVLLLHPRVTDAVVIGVTDPHYGELIKAIVVCDDESVDEQQLLAHSASQLTEYKMPKNIEFRQEIPRSPLGKVLRKYLQ